MGIKIRLFIAFCIAVILMGGALALLANTPLREPAYAARTMPRSDLSVVGPPSLSADTVDAIFARLGSPMAGTGALVEQTSQQVHIDDAFALAVWWTETNDGAAGVGLADRNPGSVRGSVGYPSAYDGYTIYPSYADAIVYWFHMLQNRYVALGLTSVYAISHPYVGTSTSYLWAGKVVALMLRYRGESYLPPTPAASPTVPALNRHNMRPLDTGNAQSSASSTSNRRAVLHAVPALKPAQPSAALSATATWLIAACALLLALAIALAAHLMRAPLPSSARFPTFNDQPARCSSTAPVTDALSFSPAFQSPGFRLPSRPLIEPRTDALVSSPLTSAPATFLPAASKLRRTQLRPASPTFDERQEELPVQLGRRPTGLLARYGEQGR